MADVPLLTVIDATEVGIGHVPKRAGEILFPILNPIFVLIT